jgi:RNA polymerase sigma-70 factor (ECF subfamily)
MPDANSDILSLSEKMSLAQAGNKQAYEELLLEISVELKPFLARKIANESDREDVLQNILIAIHNGRHSYTPGRSFKPWLYAIANHKVIDYYRSNRRKADNEVADIDSEIAFTDETESLFETKEYLMQLLNTLPPKQAKILKLMKLDGLSVKETAAIMEMSISAVKVSAHRAYKTFRVARVPGNSMVKESKYEN